MALEITGKLVNLLEPVTGNGSNGPWTKREFILETQEQYPKKVCLEAWNDKALVLDKLTPGTEIKASFDVQSREFNNRWYTNLRIWKLEVNNNTMASESNGNGFQNAPSAPMPSAQEISNNFGPDGGEDLPF